jgi:hypothetical protein
MDLLTIMREVWIEAKGAPDYLVSNFGNIIYKSTGEPPRLYDIKGRIHVYFGRNTVYSRQVSLNRVIANSFFDANIDGMEVNHIDGDKTNNAIWNLEVVTHEENMEHAYRMGLMPRPYKILNVETGETYRSLLELSRALGLCSSARIPKEARETGSSFKLRGCWFRIV